MYKRQQECVVGGRADQNRPGVYDRTDHDGRTVVRSGVSSNNRQRALRLPVERDCITCSHAHYTAAGRRQRTALDCRAVNELDRRRSSTDLNISTRIIEDGIRQNQSPGGSFEQARIRSTGGIHCERSAQLAGIYGPLVEERQPVVSDLPGALDSICLLYTSRCV